MRLNCSLELGCWDVSQVVNQFVEKDKLDLGSPGLQ